jgi:hypothetical protein
MHVGKRGFDEWKAGKIANPCSLFALLWRCHDMNILPPRCELKIFTLEIFPHKRHDKISQAIV